MKKLNQGFTLIELLVVITIIAILASISVPVYNNIIGKARSAKALSNAKQIVTACKIYAGDNGGDFPKADPTDPSANGTDSNECLKWLIPEYCPTESIFAAEGSKYASRNDDKFDDDPATASETLKAGENHWGYVIGVSDSLQENHLVLFDGDAGSANGTWTDSATKPGSRGGGSRAIIVKSDLSAENAKLDSSFKLKAPAGVTFADFDPFAKATASDLKPVNPATGGTTP